MEIDMKEIDTDLEEMVGMGVKEKVIDTKVAERVIDILLEKVINTGVIGKVIRIATGIEETVEAKDTEAVGKEIMTLIVGLTEEIMALIAPIHPAEKMIDTDLIEILSIEVGTEK